MRVLILLDHDNLPQTPGTVTAVVTAWLDSIDAPTPTAFVNVRAYGGWFRGDEVSSSRFAAADYYQQNCPSILRPGETLCRLTFEFADSLLHAVPDVRDDAAPRITHTVATRTAPLFADFRRDVSPCHEADCELSMTRKWIKKKRACAKQGCAHSFGDFFTRTEQKQVDVHMAIDVTRALSVAYDHVVLVSEDWDMLPALLSASDMCLPHQRLTLIRIRSGRSYLDDVLIKRGVCVIENVQEFLTGGGA